MYQLFRQFVKRLLYSMLMLTTAQAAWTQEPSAIGSIRYNEELGAGLSGTF